MVQVKDIDTNTVGQRSDTGENEEILCHWLPSCQWKKKKVKDILWDIGKKEAAGVLASAYERVTGGIASGYATSNDGN